MRTMRALLLRGLVLTAGIPVGAQVVTIQPRASVDAFGGTLEPAITATGTVRVAVCRSPATPSGIRYAVSTTSAPTWVAATCPNTFASGGTVATLVDPSIIVLDAQADEFMVCAVNAARVVVNKYTSSTDSFAGWQDVAVANQLGGGILDKSWIVSRGGGELLVTAFPLLSSQGGFVYSRSSDYGVTWFAGHADVQGVPVPTAFCVQPTVSADGKVYVARVTGDLQSGGDIRFVVGRSGTNNTMNFAHLLDSSGNQVAVVAHLNGNSMPAPGTPTSKTVPILVADPSNNDRLFLGYHDIDPASSDPTDINIYVVRLDYSATSHAWSAGSPVRVNTDSVTASTQPDQFTPWIAVDARGRVHAIFYDNRGCYPTPCSTPTYDVFYALSTDHGVTFSNQNLASTPAVQSQSSFSPGEYIGITILNTAAAAELWTSYTGNYQLSSTGIFGSAISVTW